MKSWLEELWYGNLCPQTDAAGGTGEEKERMRDLSRHHERLMATLAEGQKELFEQFDDCYAEVTGIRECEIFSCGFRLGARMVMEIMGFRPE